MAAPGEIRDREYKKFVESPTRPGETAIEVVGNLSVGNIDIGTVDQGLPNTLPNAWPVYITDGTDQAIVNPVNDNMNYNSSQHGIGIFGADQSVNPKKWRPIKVDFEGHQSTHLVDTANNTITSTLAGSKQALDVYLVNQTVNTTPSITNAVAVLANTEYSFSLPANCKGFLIKARQICRMKLSYSSGGPFVSIGLGGDFYDANFYTSQVIYYSVDRTSTDIEIITYS